MFPDAVLSTAPVTAPTLAPVRRRTTPLVSYELGGIHLYDASAGLSYQLWTLEVVGGDFLVHSPGTPEPQLLLHADGVLSADLAFDQNGRPCVCYTTDVGAAVWYYDTVLGAYNTYSVAGALSACITLDTRIGQGSDVVFAMTMPPDHTLHYRLQRDRFLTDRIFPNSNKGRLIGMGMNTQNRVQFRQLPN